MWEVLNRRVPYNDMISDSVESMQNLMQYVCLGGRLITKVILLPKSFKKKYQKSSDRPSSSPNPTGHL